MSRKYKFDDIDELYFITFSVVFWIDIFIRNEYKDILINSWKYCQQNKGLEVYGWVIMTNHDHMIIGSHGRRMQDIVRDFKSYSSTQLRKAITQNPFESRKEWIFSMMTKAGSQNSNNWDWQFWQQHNQPIQLDNCELFHQKLSYMHENPVKAGFVEKEEEWVYSSARDFYGRVGLIELSYIV